MFRTHRATICWMLAFVMTVSPSMVLAQAPGAPPATPTTPPASPAEAAVAAEKVDVSYVTPGAVLAVVAFPRRVLTAPEMEMLPIEVFSAGGQKELGIDPLDVEQILIVAELAQPPMPEVGLVVRLAKDYQAEAVLPRLRGATTEGTIEGKPYRRAASPVMPSVYMPDSRTLIVANDSMLQKMVAQKANPAEGPMSKLLGRMDATSDVLAVLRAEPLRPVLGPALAGAPLPPPLEGVRKVPELVSVVGLKVKLTGRQHALLSVRARDEAAAGELQQLVDQLLALAQQSFLAEINRRPPTSDPVEQAATRYAQRMSGRIVEMLRPVRKGDRLELSLDPGNMQTQLATSGVLVALLLPAVQAAREAARRAQSSNNLKQIALAMLNHESATGAYPARANFDPQGKPLLSWRVHILPYLEQEALYKEFHLDEPWDSPHNKPLVERMPSVYRNPSSAAPPGTTTYLAPVGPGTVFEGAKGRSIREITDGTSNTVLVLEANDDRAVPWTKPDDWTYNPAEPTAGFGKAHPGGALAVFCDGSVHFLAVAISPTVLKAILTCAGGETTGPQ